MRNLRRRIERSERVARVLGRMLAAWLRFCDRTTRWETEGTEEIAAALARGPVVLVLWHECAMLAPVHWPRAAGPITTLRDTSAIGRVSGAVQAAFGLSPLPMSARAANTAMSREILRRVAAGDSIGLTGDGPLGPRRVMKSAPLDWARATGAPVFVYAFTTARHKRLQSWDRMILPLPFTTGRRTFARWDGTVPRRADAATTAALAASLTAALDRITPDDG